MTHRLRIQCRRPGNQANRGDEAAGDDASRGLGLPASFGPDVGAAVSPTAAAALCPASPRGAFGWVRDQPEGSARALGACGADGVRIF